jgi:hypothetical protein
MSTHNRQVIGHAGRMMIHSLKTSPISLTHQETEDYPNYHQRRVTNAELGADSRLISGIENNRKLCKRFTGDNNNDGIPA